jgi:hypothetical protein
MFRAPEAPRATGPTKARAPKTGYRFPEIEVGELDRGSPFARVRIGIGKESLRTCYWSCEYKSTPEIRTPFLDDPPDERRALYERFPELKLIPERQAELQALALGTERVMREQAAPVDCDEQFLRLKPMAEKAAWKVARIFGDGKVVFRMKNDLLHKERRVEDAIAQAHLELVQAIAKYAQAPVEREGIRDALILKRVKGAMWDWLEMETKGSSGRAECLNCLGEGCQQCSGRGYVFRWREIDLETTAMVKAEADPEAGPRDPPSQTVGQCHSIYPTRRAGEETFELAQTIKVGRGRLDRTEDNNIEQDGTVRPATGFRVIEGEVIAREIHAELVAAVKAALRELPRTQRSYIIEWVVRDRSQSEIAARNNGSQSKVSRQIDAGMGSLKDLIPPMIAGYARLRFRSPVASALVRKAAQKAGDWWGEMRNRNKGNERTQFTARQRSITLWVVRPRGPDGFPQELLALVVEQVRQPVCIQ